MCIYVIYTRSYIGYNPDLCNIYYIVSYLTFFSCITSCVGKNPVHCNIFLEPRTLLGCHIQQFCKLYNVLYNNLQKFGYAALFNADKIWQDPLLGSIISCFFGYIGNK